MYLNTKKENTNIDNQFKQSNEFDISKYKMPIIIVASILLLVIIVAVIFSIKKNQKKYYIDLYGDEEITMYQGSTYTEIGYKGYDNKQNDLTQEVAVNNSANMDKIGQYQITYKLKNIEKIRTINIIEAGEDQTNIYLKGDTTITLLVGDKYEEAGYIAIDSKDGDITKKVEVNQKTDTSKPGIYEIIYSVVNSQGISTTAKRVISVQEDNMKNLPNEK